MVVYYRVAGRQAGKKKEKKGGKIMEKKSYLKLGALSSDRHHIWNKHCTLCVCVCVCVPVCTWRNCLSA